MWRTLASRVYGCIVATLLIALAASVTAVFALWSTSHSMEAILQDNLPSVIAGEELEIALLEQRGCISWFLLTGGDQRWLDELHNRQRTFQVWLERAQSIAFTDEERRILEHLSEVVERYNARRLDVIELFRGGQPSEAQRLLLSEVNELHREAYDWCEQLINANQRLMGNASQRSVAIVERVTVGMLFAIALQLAVGATLLWIFARTVLGPLRQMSVDLRGYSSAHPHEQRTLSDEVESVARYLRLLLTDVDDFRSTLEQQRRQLFDAQKMASVGRLAANLAHEIRNPLTAIKMWLFAARNSVSDRSEVALTLDSVVDEVRRLEAVVRQYLEFARPPDTRLAWVPTKELIANSVALVQPLIREKGITLHALPPEIPCLYVDRDQMMQVLVNLLRNAAESLQVGGSILVAAEGTKDSAGHVHAILRVSDNGPGIPRELQARMFDPFFTTKEEGTGLGLSIVDSIVIRHGGRVEVRSGAREGTEIAVHLPSPSESDTHEHHSDR